MSAASYPHVPSLGAGEHIDINGGYVTVGCSSLANLQRPISFTAGIIGFICSPAEAVALGDALIRMAHHYTAALAEYQASLGEQAVQS